MLSSPSCMLYDRSTALSRGAASSGCSSYSPSCRRGGCGDSVSAGESGRHCQAGSRRAQLPAQASSRPSHNRLQQRAPRLVDAPLQAGHVQAQGRIQRPLQAALPQQVVPRQRRRPRGVAAQQGRQAGQDLGVQVGAATGRQEAGGDGGRGAPEGCTRRHGALLGRRPGCAEDRRRGCGAAHHRHAPVAAHFQGRGEGGHRGKEERCQQEVEECHDLRVLRGSGPGRRQPGEGVDWMRC